MVRLGHTDLQVKESKVRYVAASNYSATRFAEALAISDTKGSHSASNDASGRRATR